ncbi:hypothetical protein Hanom_Chr14g01315621 [Helianthus anomalus]
MRVAAESVVVTTNAAIELVRLILSPKDLKRDNSNHNSHQDSILLSYHLNVQDMQYRMPGDQHQRLSLCFDKPLGDVSRSLDSKKRLTVNECKTTGKDIRALKQILEAMQKAKKRL